MIDVRPTRRWRGVAVLTLAAAGVALLAKRPVLLLVSTLGVVYAVYPRLSGVTEPELRLDRTLSEDNPRDGAEVEVTTTVTNVGDRPVFDLRLVDGVPPALAVTDGTPRFGTALRSGEDASITYTVEAKQGRHRFEPATAIVRTLSGGQELEQQLDADTQVDCTTSIRAAPIRSQTLDITGQHPANSGGSGTEFHQTRSYRRGDPVGRVDWNRYARTGDLTTIEFREEQTASVVLVVDTTPDAYRGQDDDPHAVVHSIAAAQQLFEAVLDGQNHAGLTALGRDDVWLEPSNGYQHRVRAQELLDTHAAFSRHPPDPETTVDLDEQIATLRARLTDSTQLFVLSPLLSDAIVDAIRRFEAAGHSVTVVSPKVTHRDGDVDGRTLAAIERENRIRRLRQTDVHAIDWSPDTPLAATLRRRMEVRYR